MTTTLNANPNLPATLEPEFITAGDACVVSVAEGYKRWAATYDAAPNPLLAREERHLLPLLGDLRGKSVLDLACGTGRWLQRLAAAGGSGAGIDCSEAMLRIAETKDAIKSRVAQAACERLPFRGAVFDLAICSFALGHFRDLGSMVGELARVMKPGGDVFISDLHPDAYARGWRVGFRDQDAEVHIEITPRPVEEIVSAFSGDGFECLAREALWLGEPERPYFERGAKSYVFSEACQLSAILICHFKRGASVGRRSFVQQATEAWA